MSKLLPVPTSSSCSCAQLRVRSVLRLRLARRELAATSRLLKYMKDIVTSVLDPCALNPDVDPGLAEQDPVPVQSCFMTLQNSCKKI
jgi:hypothetical protein